MPLQFECPKCARKLQVDEKLQGSKIRCPGCEHVFEIGPSSQSPFTAAVPMPGAPAATTEEENPFASPMTQSSAREYDPDLFKKRAVRPTRFGFSEMLELSWDLFKANAGPTILTGFCVLGIMMLCFLPFYMISLITQLSENLTYMIIGQAVTQLGAPMVNAVVFCVSIGMFLKILRGEQPFDDMLGTLKRFWPMVGFHYLLTLITMALFLLLGGTLLAAIFMVAPAQRMDYLPLYIIFGVLGYIVLLVVSMYLMARWFLTYFFIVDRNLPILESMKISAQCMQGNKLTFILIMVTLGFASLPLIACTCGVGYFVVAGFMGLLVSIIYLKATGQLDQQPDSHEENS